MPTLASNNTSSLPGTSPSPNLKSARQSVGPNFRSQAPATLSPMLPTTPIAAVRPTSELLGSAGMATPEVEALDRWLQNFQNYEATLEEMAAASLDVNFKEELTAIEQWFRVLSEAERTAALYSLLQQATHVQIRFFMTMLHEMARNDPLSALLSPTGGQGGSGSMQAQMEAKLASMNLKSPGLPKAPPSPRPGATSATFLAADNIPPSPNPEAAATLAQQRARLKATSADAAARRISAPSHLSNLGEGRNVWQSPQLDQVDERSTSPAPEPAAPSAGLSAVRPKSTDFSVLSASLKNRPSAISSVLANEVTSQDGLSPLGGGNWASMVNTPLIPMFQVNENNPNLDSAVNKLNTWQANKPTPPSTNGRITLADAKSFRRPSKTGNDNQDDNGQNGRNLRNPSIASGGGSNWGGMSSARSPALSNVSSNRFATAQDDIAAQLAASGMNFGYGGMGLQGMLPILAAAQMGGMGGANLNMMDPVQANLMMQMQQMQLAQAQAQAQGGLPGMFPSPFGMQNRSARMPNTGRSTKSSSMNGREPPPLSEEEEMRRLDQLLNDVPAWLKSLRLHKYKDNFANDTWRTMIELDDAALTEKGVAAKGARDKLIKTFAEVKEKKGMA